MSDRRIKDEQVDPKEIWLAIRYLDPDKTDDGDTVRTKATIMTLFALVIMLCVLWGILWLKVREP